MEGEGRMDDGAVSQVLCDEPKKVAEIYTDLKARGYFRDDVDGKKSSRPYSELTVLNNANRT